MDKIKAILFSIIIFNSTLLSQEEWIWQNPKPQANSLFEVIHLSEDEILAVGFKTPIMRSSDSGDSWTFSWQDEILYYLSIYTYNSKFCWTTGINYENKSSDIFRSTDSGINWEKIAVFDSLAIVDLFFVDSLVGWCVSGNGNIYKSFDGGLTWTNQFSEVDKGLYCIYFLNDSTGWIGGSDGLLLYTSNSGELWQSVESSTTESINQIYFFDKDSGWVLSRELLKTIDGGENWIKPSINTEYSLWFPNQIQFLDSNNGWLLDDRLIFNTVDGGENWTLNYEAILGDEEFTSFDFASENTGIVVGHEGKIKITQNGGETWSDKLSGYNGEIIDIFFINSSLGWAVSSNDSIALKTINGGENWTSINIPGVDDLQAVYFIDENTGWITGGYYSISSVMIKTVDGGNTWTNQSTGVESYLNDVFFINNKVGWAVGKDFVIGTTNGGDEWDVLWNKNDSYLSSVYFIDANFGWAVGRGGLIIKSTDGGVSWDTLNSGTTEGLSTICFINESVGIVCGAEGKIIKTINGGLAWEYKESGTTRSMYDCTFVNEDIIYVVGNNGQICKSFDGGENWETFNSISQKSLYAVHGLSNGNLWAAGGDGTIIHANLTITNLDEEILTQSSFNYFMLQQNYPNPFNPSTTIKYSIPKQSNVTLKVYDVLGSEVVTLVNKEQAQGNYEVEFDGTDLSSGIYFYRLKAGDFVETRKMILIK